MGIEPRPEVAENCLRCGAPMEWRHGTGQCPAGRFELGCCRGETGDCQRVRP